MREAKRRRATTRGGLVGKSIALTRARIEAVEEIAAERGGLSLSATIEELLKLGIQTYRDKQRQERVRPGQAEEAAS